MMTEKDFKEILSKIFYKGWDIRLRYDDDRPYLQVLFKAADVDTGDMENQSCRKYFLSTHMTETEVVDTVFMAIMRAEEHEVKENFYYEGVRVFNPHTSIRARMSVAMEMEKRQ